MLREVLGIGAVLSAVYAVLIAFAINFLFGVITGIPMVGCNRVFGR